MSDRTRTYNVTVKITVDRGDYDNPSEWDWPMLLDLPHEDVQLVESKRSKRWE